MIVAVDCGDLEDPVNGMVTTPGTTYLSVATYSCNEGHIRIGAATRICNVLGNWTVSPPLCESKYTVMK